VFSDGGVSPFLPDVTDGGDHDVLVSRAVLQVAPAHPARTDQAELDPVVGAGLSRLRQNTGGNNQGNCRTCDGRLA
jgi:hypothetical protein